MSGGGGELIDATRITVRAVTGWLRRRLPECVVGAAVLVTLLVVLAFAGSLLDDRTIAADRVITTAEVLDGSSFSRTLVRFTLADGQAVVPERGVLYPRGLTPGTTLLVEYSAAEPEVVRVAGRTAFDRIGPLAGVVGVTWLVLGPLAWWLRDRRNRRATGQPGATT